jgi:hypothetical protein
MAATNGNKRQQNATKCYKMLHGLTVEQQNAIDRLVARDTERASGQSRRRASRYRQQMAVVSVG